MSDSKDAIMSFHQAAMTKLFDGLKGLRDKADTEYGPVLAANPGLRDLISNILDGAEAHGQLATALAGGQVAETVTEDSSKKAAGK